MIGKARKHLSSRSRTKFKRVPLSKIEDLLPPVLRHSLREAQRKKKSRQSSDKKSTPKKHSTNGNGVGSNGAGNMHINYSKDLWISPTLNLRGRHGDRAWERSGNLPPGAGMRLLELADIRSRPEEASAPKEPRKFAGPRNQQERTLFRLNFRVSAHTQSYFHKLSARNSRLLNLCYRCDQW